jgi:type IV pilus assembly protein PilB
MPTLHGEKLVLRILNAQSQPTELASLGYETDELDRLHRALEHSDGMLLMTGPTGSGKTRSLYSCLNWLNRTELNISTLEDPIEIQIPGINQVQIHERVGLSFAHALRALLRQDPDVIMLGEIRDLDTADVAMQAAQTGHLVLSTLHTPNAPSALARLQHMGLATHHVAASVRLVVAQRLLRRLCVHCRQPLSASQHAHLLSAGMQPDGVEHAAPPGPEAQFYSPVGCSQCQDGYSGRVGVFQVMPVSEAMQSLLFKQADAQTLATLARQEQVRTLRQSAWLKAARGLTSIQEVWQHTPAV